MEPADVRNAPPVRLTLGDAALDAAEGQAVVAPPDPCLPVEHGAPEAAPRIEHARLGREPGDLEEVIVDVLEPRGRTGVAAAAAGHPESLVHRERRMAIAVGHPVAELDVARQPVVEV